jgi:hypothetical protein
MLSLSTETRKYLFDLPICFRFPQPFPGLVKDPNDVCEVLSTEWGAANLFITAGLIGYSYLSGGSQNKINKVVDIEWNYVLTLKNIAGVC